MKVNSSAVSDILYINKTLYVTYKANDINYAYKNVPEHVYNNLTKAESIGKFINSEIKGKYSFEKRNKK